MDELLATLTKLREDLLTRYRYCDPHLDEAIHALAEGQLERCRDLLDQQVVIYIDRDWPEVSVPMLQGLQALTLLAPQAV